MASASSSSKLSKINNVDATTQPEATQPEEAPTATRKSSSSSSSGPFVAKRRICVVRKKQTINKPIFKSKALPSCSSSSVRKVVGRQPRRGLPSFKRTPQPGLPTTRIRHHGTTSSTTHFSSSNNNEETEQDDDPFFTREDSLFLQGELPSDTMLVFQSLCASDQGLHIPLLQSTTTVVQAILESQLYQRFQSDHASTTLQEFKRLLANNQIRQLSCPPNSTKRALLSTQHYCIAVWDSFENWKATTSPHVGVAPASSVTLQARQEDQFNQKVNIHHQIMEWILSLLSHCTEPTISLQTMKQHWKPILSENHLTNDNSSTSTCPRTLITLEDHALPFLVRDVQVLRRDDRSSNKNHHHDENELYQLWLPTWGTVLQGWNRAGQQLLLLLARKGGEVSEQNIVRSSSFSSCISTRFLLDDLRAQGKIRFRQRPFGRFIQLVKT